MSQRVIGGLVEFKEVNLFLRGIIPVIGYKAGYVYYERYEGFINDKEADDKKYNRYFAFQNKVSLRKAAIKFVLNVVICYSICI